MIAAIVLAVIIAVAVGLVCVLVGRVLKSVAVPPAVAVGGFLEQFAWAIGILAGLWWFFSGGRL